MTRAFATLSPQEAVHVAIFIEERNAGIYQRFAEMFTEFRDTESLEIAGVFWDMSVEEKRHSSQLQASYYDCFGNSSCALTEEDLQELIEVPKLESGDVFAPADHVKTSPRTRALQVALAAEKSAHDFYEGLVARTEDGAMRRLYVQLSMMEDGHVGYLQNLLTESMAEGEKEAQ
jgi:rubrerythrin